MIPLPRDFQDFLRLLNANESSGPFSVFPGHFPTAHQAMPKFLTTSPACRDGPGLDKRCFENCSPRHRDARPDALPLRWREFHPPGHFCPGPRPRTAPGAVKIRRQSLHCRNASTSSAQIHKMPCGLNNPFSIRFCARVRQQTGTPALRRSSNAISHQARVAPDAAPVTLIRPHRLRAARPGSPTPSNRRAPSCPKACVPPTS